MPKSNEFGFLEEDIDLGFIETAPHSLHSLHSLRLNRLNRLNHLTAAAGGPHAREDNPLELQLKTEQDQKEIVLRKEFMAKARQDQAAADPENWTVQQVKDHLKRNPVQSVEQEAQWQGLIMKKQREIKRIMEKQYPQTELRAAPAKSLKESIDSATNYFLRFPGEITPEEKRGHDWNIYALSEVFGLPRKTIKRNYAHYASQIQTQEPNTLELMQAIAFPPLTAGLVAATVANPLVMAGRIAVYQGLSEIENAAVSRIKNTDYKFLQGRPVSDLLPEEAARFSREVVDLMDMLGKAYITGGIMKKAPVLAERLTKDIVTEYKLPQKLYVPANAIKQSGGWTSKTVGDLKDAGISLSDADIAKIQAAFYSGKEAQVEIPSSVVIKLVDKPIWARIKSVLSIKPAEKVITIIPTGQPWAAGKKPPLALLGPLDSATLEGQGPGVSPPAADRIILPAPATTVPAYAGIETAGIAAGGMARGREIPAQITKWMEKGVTITERQAPIKIVDPEAKIKDINDKVVDLPIGHEMTPYKLSNGKIWLHDGKDVIVETGQLQNLSNKNLVLGEKQAAAGGQVPEAVPLDVEGNDLVGLKGEPIEINNDGTITLYHRTTLENAKRIKKTGIFTSKENTNETFFSNKLKGQSESYGDGVVTVKVKPSDIRLNDVFPGGEISVAIKNNKLSKSKLSTEGLVEEKKIGNIKFEQEGDAVGREYHETIYAIDPETGKKMGYVKHSYSQGESSVQMVEVKPEYRKQGVGLALLNELQLRSEKPLAILGNFATKEGQALWKKFKGQEMLSAPAGEKPEASVILPQEVLEKDLEKVPEIKKERVKQVFAAATQEDIERLTLSDPDFVKAIKLNKQAEANQEPLDIGLSQDPGTWPNGLKAFIFKADRKAVLPVKNPEAIIFLGYPGSGKSIISRELGLNDTHIVIDPDDAKPFVHADLRTSGAAHNRSVQWAENILLDKVIAEKKNIIWPKVGKNPESLQNKISDLEAKGYKVKIFFNDLPQAESLKRTYKRFLETGRIDPMRARLIDPDYIKKINSLTIKGVYDKVKLGHTHKHYDVNVKFGQKYKVVEEVDVDEKIIDQERAASEDIRAGGVSQGAIDRGEPGGALGRGVRDLPAEGPVGEAAQPAAESVESVESAEVIPPQEPEIFQPGEYTKQNEQDFLNQYDTLTPEERAVFDLEMDDLRKTPEANLLVAIRKLGKIKIETNAAGLPTARSKDWPASIKDKSSGNTLDGIKTELETYGWHFDDDSELSEAIKEAAAHQEQPADRAELRRIIREAEKNKKLQQIINDKFKKTRKFIKTVKESEKTAPEVAGKIRSLYDPITNAETLKQAQEYIAASPEEALQLVEGPGKPTAFSNAVAIVLIDKAQVEGRFSDAIRLVEKTAEKQTSLGQAIQALSMYNRLTPEGILQFANKIVREGQARVKQKERLVKFDKESEKLTDKEKSKLAKKLGVPFLSEEEAAKIHGAAVKMAEWPDPPPFNAPPANAYQYWIDEFQKLIDSPEELNAGHKQALQLAFDEFRKILPDSGELGPPDKSGYQFVIDEFQKLLSEGPDTGELSAVTQGIQDVMKISSGLMSRGKRLETLLLLKQIQQLIPSTLGQRIATYQTLSQLLNPKTIIRNLLGNLGFALLENFSDVFGTAIDLAVSQVTGKRTQYLPNIPTQIKGEILGWKQGQEEALLGVSLSKRGGKFDLPANGIYNNKVMAALEQTLRLVLAAPDQAFFQAAFNQSIYNDMKAAGVDVPTDEMLERAVALGLYRTYQDDTVLAKQFVRLKKWMNVFTGGDFGFGDMILKYPRTPANILLRGIEYSPFSLLKGVYYLAEPLIGREFRQGEFVGATSRGVTGSVLSIGLGALLATMGIISGRRTKDKDVAATRENVGIKEYQLNVSALKRLVLSGMDPEQAKWEEDDILVTYDWFLPASIGIALGANMVLDPKSNLVDKALNFGDRLLAATETLQEQPLLQGVRVLTNRQNIAEGLSQVAKGLPASMTPTLLNQVKQLTDNTVRNTKDPNFFKEVYNKTIVRIPGLSKTLPPRITSLGQERSAYQFDSNNPFNVFLNPAFVTKYKPDPVSKMVLDIWESTGETVHFPRVASVKIKLGGNTAEPVELNPEQYTEYQKYIGNRTDVLFTILSEKPEFMARPDDEKAKMLQGYLTDINSAAKIAVLGYRPEKASDNVISILKMIGRDKRKLDALIQPIQPQAVQAVGVQGSAADGLGFKED